MANEQALRDRMAVMEAELDSLRAENDRLRAERETLDDLVQSSSNNAKEVIGSIQSMGAARRRVMVRARRAEVDADRLAYFLDRMRDFLEARGYTRMADLLDLLAQHAEAANQRTEE
jgi:hypothetical protein